MTDPSTPSPAYEGFRSMVVPHGDAGLAGPAPDIASSASRVGAYVWCEARLFEVTGAWVTSTGDERAKLYLGDLTAVFAWHAEQWRDRLPSLREVSRESLMVAPSSRAEEAAAMLCALTEPIERLSALSTHVLPWLCDRYRTHEQTADPVRDAPVLRTLALVRADHEAAIANIELLLREISTIGYDT